MIRGNIRYSFNYDFQQEDLVFEFNIHSCYIRPSTFILMDDRQEDDEYGIYVEILDDIVYLRQYDISEEIFNNLDLNDNHLFFTWKVLWQEYYND